MSTIRKAGVIIKGYNEFIYIRLNDRSVRIFKGTFDCLQKPLHNKVFTHKIIIQKQGFLRYRKSKEEFYLNQHNAPIFDSLEKLIAFYNKPDSVRKDCFVVN